MKCVQRFVYVRRIQNLQIVDVDTGLVSCAANLDQLGAYRFMFQVRNVMAIVQLHCLTKLSDSNLSFFHCAPLHLTRKASFDFEAYCLHRPLILLWSLWEMPTS